MIIAIFVIIGIVIFIKTEKENGENRSLQDESFGKFGHAQASFRRYTRDFIESFRDADRTYGVGGINFGDDVSINTLRLTIQLEESRFWFLTVFVKYDSDLISFSLDEEAADDSHYQFVDEASVRSVIYEEGDEDLYLHEVFIRYLKDHKGSELYYKIKPYITNEYHFY